MRIARSLEKCLVCTMDTCGLFLVSPSVMKLLTKGSIVKYQLQM